MLACARRDRRGRGDQRVCCDPRARPAALVVGPDHRRQQLRRAHARTPRRGPASARAGRTTSRQPRVPRRPVPRRPAAARSYPGRAAAAGSRPTAALLAPAGIGGHPDHLLVRAAAFTLRDDGHTVALCAELPHAIRHGWPHHIDNGSRRGPAGRARSTGNKRLTRSMGRSARRPSTHCPRRRAPRSSRRSTRTALNWTRSTGSPTNHSTSPTPFATRSSGSSDSSVSLTARVDTGCPRMRARTQGP